MGGTDSSSALQVLQHPPSNILGGKNGRVNPGITRHKDQGGSRSFRPRYGSEKALRKHVLDVSPASDAMRVSERPTRIVEGAHPRGNRAIP